MIGEAPDPAAGLDETLAALDHEIRDWLESAPAAPALPELDAAAVRARLARHDFTRPVPTAEAFAEAADLLRRGTVHTTSPRYFGLFNPSVRPGSIAGDALTALYNPQLALNSHAPAANEIERHVLRFLSPRFGYPEDAWANFTAGGSEANLTAMAAALTHSFPEYGRRGLRSLPADPVLYVSDQAHHSFEKNAHLLGLGREAVRTVATDDGGRLHPGDLERAVAADRASGRAPFLVVGTVGTTTLGAVDPLADIAAVCRREGLWFHADAAWGGAAVMVPALAKHLEGIAETDSITCDAHKFFSVSMGAGMFFCRRSDAVRATFGVRAPYVLESIEGEDDPYASTVQWSRRCIGLKVFLTLAELGESGLAAMIARQTALGDRLRALVRERGFMVVGDTPLPLVCFTHPRIDSGAVRPGDVLKKVYARRRVWLSEAVFRERRVLRACITSYRTGPGDLEVLVDEVESALAG